MHRARELDAADGGGGKSWNFYNAGTGKWEQVWLSAGSVLKLEGSVKDGEMRYEGKTPRPSGEPILNKLTFTPMPPNRVHRFGNSPGTAGRLGRMLSMGSIFRSSWRAALLM